MTKPAAEIAAAVIAQARSWVAMGTATSGDRIESSSALRQPQDHSCSRRLTLLVTRLVGDGRRTPVPGDAENYGKRGPGPTKASATRPAAADTNPARASTLSPTALTMRPSRPPWMMTPSRPE